MATPNEALLFTMFETLLSPFRFLSFTRLEQGSQKQKGLQRK
jgi:hypothetical protein